MKTKKKQRQKSLKVHLKLDTHMFVRKSWSIVWICLKDVYVLLGEIQKTCFLAKTTLILL